MADVLPTTLPRTKETRTPCPWTSLQPKPLVKTQGNLNKKLQTSTPVEPTQDHTRKMGGSHQMRRCYRHRMVQETMAGMETKP